MHGHYYLQEVFLDLSVDLPNPLYLRPATITVYNIFMSSLQIECYVG